MLAEVAGAGRQFQRSLDFFLASSTDATISPLPVGAAEVSALQKALQEKARQVEIMDPFARISIDERKFECLLHQHAAEAGGGGTAAPVGDKAS